MESKKEKRPMSFAAALGVFVFLIAAVVAMSVGLKTPPHVPLLVGTIFAAAVGAAHRYSWKEMQEGMVDAIKTAMPSLLIIMVVGVVVGMWMIGGVIPSMVYYGLQIISPRFFLVTTLLICSVVSLALGSSLSTIGTVGVALFGIGEALGVAPAITVGAIVSGAYFGDKMSPLSDTTNLAPAVSGGDLFLHVQHMMGTTVPTYIICILLYGGIGLFTVGSDGGERVQQSLQILEGLSAEFWISPLLLLPPLAVIVIVLLRVPALPGLLAAAGLGMLCAFFFQGAGLADVANAVTTGYVSASADATLQTLLTRGGMLGMMRTVALAITSLSFAGIFEKTGMANAIVEKMLRRVKSEKGLIITTVLTAWMILLATGQQYVAIIITGRLLRKTYEQRHLAPENLSRALEDSGTVFGAIVPHSTGASFTEGALGVTAWQYGPFTFFGWINPLVSIIMAALGKGIKPAAAPAPPQRQEGAPPPREAEKAEVE